MICKEVMRKLEERWNPSYALEWDNVGLLVGREEKEIKKIFTAMKKTKLLRPLVEKMENKAMKKRDQIEKYEFWGLVLFVGIPLPGTGAWTGALVASLIDMDIKKAFKAILLGICLAAVIMTLISYGVLGHIIR